jgi:sensor histidine kinase YesM
MSGELPPFSADGCPPTTKEDVAQHGYGMRNMKRIAEKYFGTVSLEQESDMAVFTAMLMIAG